MVKYLLQKFFKSNKTPILIRILRNNTSRLDISVPLIMNGVP